jgi:hypothetical protein
MFDTVFTYQYNMAEDLWWARLLNLANGDNEAFDSLPDSPSNIFVEPFENSETSIPNTFPEAATPNTFPGAFIPNTFPGDSIPNTFPEAAMSIHNQSNTKEVDVGSCQKTKQSPDSDK